MESIRGAEDYVYQIVLGASENSDGSMDGTIERTLETLGLSDLYDDVVHFVAKTDMRANEMAGTALIRGDLESVQVAQGNAIFVAFLIGYKLGMSHTADRVSVGSIPERCGHIDDAVPEGTDPRCYKEEGHEGPHMYGPEDPPPPA